ncbi:hypothetical protein EVAR_72716_1 [Eumeta japonica]|uniref:Uncharacterized protein n=1 Tax=Eumeta variegata TaxID=151549 RepID=A0A4C1SH06_EUMVA|nr:hypothetical protein EVAR_72716_1 [Eumeta japonica]
MPGNEARVSPPSRACGQKLKVTEDPRRRRRSCVKNAKHMATPPRLKYMQVTYEGGCATYKLQRNWCIRRRSSDFCLVVSGRARTTYHSDSVVADRSSARRRLVRHHLAPHIRAAGNDRAAGHGRSCLCVFVRALYDLLGYPVLAVHKMHRGDGTALGMTLAILEKTDVAKDIFKNLSKVYGLSGIYAEAPYSRKIPGRCHRYQLYGHEALNCHAQP